MSVAVESNSQEIKSRWPVAPPRPTALAWTVEHRRRFSAGSEPQKLVVSNSDNGKVLQSFAISSGVDRRVRAVDPAGFFSTREGMVHVFHEDSPANS